MDDFGDPEALSAHMLTWTREHLGIGMVGASMDALLVEIDNFRAQERAAIRCEAYSQYGLTCLQMEGDVGYCPPCEKDLMA
jgi:hypothetical protein